MDLDTVRIYLQEIGRFPMLKPDQEIVYARLVQEMLAVEKQKNALMQQLQRSPTRAELAAHIHKTEAQLTQVQELGQQAKQKMITANLRLVVAVAKKYRWSKLELLDLIQEGAIGLQKAVEKFDPNRGYKFSTCAYWWIRQAITTAVAEQSRTIRLPHELTKRLMQIKKAYAQLSQTLGRKPTMKEVASAINVKENQIWECLSAFRPLVSFDLRMGEERDIQLQEILADVRISPEECVEQELFSQNLNHAFASLTPIQRQVLILRFGLEGDVQGQTAMPLRKLTVKEIARKFNFSPSKVSQIQHRAIEILRSEQEQIRDYLAS